MKKTSIEQVLKTSIYVDTFDYIPLTICGYFRVKEFRILNFFIDEQRVWGLHEGTNNILFSNITELFFDKKDYVKNSIVFTNIYDCIEFIKKEEYPDSLVKSLENYINKCVNLDYIV